MLKQRKLFLYLSGAILLSAALFWVKSTHAQTTPGLDLTVSPPVIELNANPGDIIKERFRVRNNQATPIDLGIDVRKLSSDNVTGNPVPVNPAPDDEFISWLKVDPAKFTVLPSEWKDVNISIDVPQSAAYGYYYALRITPQKTTQFQGTGSKVNGEVLVVILLNVRKAGAQAKGQLIDFKANTFIGEYLPVDFSAKIASTGNVNIKPSGNIFIRSFHDKDVAILDINAGKSSILPGGSRTFTSSWNDGFIVNEPIFEGDHIKLDKKGKPETKITINWDKLTHFRIGKYTATLLMVYDDGQRDATIEGVSTFWLIPYTAIAVILVIIVVIIIFFRFLLRWYIAREIKRQPRH